MKRSLSTLAVSALCFGQPAFAQKVEQIAAPSGVMINHVKCSKKSNKCMNEAGKFCGGSYQVIDSESRAGGVFADVFPGPVTWYSMTFLCGKSNGQLPAFEFRGPQYKVPSIVVPQNIQTTCIQTGAFLNCTTR